MNKHSPSDDDVIGANPDDERMRSFVPESLFTKSGGSREKPPPAAAPPPGVPPASDGPRPISPGPEGEQPDIEERPVFAAPPPVPSQDRELPPLSSPANQSQALAETVVASFLDRLKAEARPWR